MGIFYFLSDITIIFLFSIIFFKVIQINEKKIEDNPYLKDLLNNLGKKPIKELYIPKNNEPCKRNFFKYEWRGVPESCNCKESNNLSLKGNIFNKKCSLYQNIYGCINIKSVSPQKVYNWKNVKICIKDHETDYSNIITITGNNCPKNYILCGVDTKNFSLCFPFQYGCPINKIIFSNTQKKISEKFTNTLKLTDDWYIHYSNNFNNSTIPIDIKYTEGRICVNPNEVNLKKTHLKYKKLNSEIEIEKQQEKLKIHPYCSTKVGKYNFDDRYFYLDSNSKFKFFSDNFISNLIEKLPQLNSQDLISQTSNLYFRSYIHWSPYCRRDVNLNHFVIIEDIQKILTIDGFYPIIQVYVFFLFIMYCFVIIFTWMKYFFKKRSDDDYNFLIKENKNQNEEIICFGIEKVRNFFSENKLDYIEKVWLVFNELFLYSVLAFVCSILFIIYFSENNIGFIKKYISQKCGDFITNEIFNDIGKKINMIVLYNYQILLNGIILLGFIIIKILI